MTERRRAAAVGVAALTCALLGASTTLTPAAQAAPAMQRASGSATKVVVLLRDQHRDVAATKARSAARRRLLTRDQASVRSLVGKLGGKTTHAYSTLNGFSATVPSGGLAALRADPNVEAVVPDLLWRLPSHTVEKPTAAAAPAVKAAPKADPTTDPTTAAPTTAATADPTPTSTASATADPSATATASATADPTATAAPTASASPTTSPTAAASGPNTAGLCPTDPSTPKLEPEALEVTHTDSDVAGAKTARGLGYTGSGVKVAYLAEGIDTTMQDFTRADGTPVFSDYQDFSGDGPSATTSGAEAFGDASSIAAQGRTTYDISDYTAPTASPAVPKGCTIRIEGMAPGASLVGLKIFANNLLTAPTSSIIQAIDYAVNTDHVDVINESFGANPYPDTALDPISVFNQDAIDAGVTVVASSGDAGIGRTQGTAATDPNVIGVGASTTERLYAQARFYGYQLGNGSYTSDQVSALSSSGISQTNKTVDLLAPGDLNWSVCSPRLDSAGDQLFTGCTNLAGDPTGFFDFGGTSESAPLTAGAAALVIQAYRQAHGGTSPTPLQIRTILDSSADDLGLPADEQGAGLLNSYRAVQLAASTGTASRSGTQLQFSAAQLSAAHTAGSSLSQTVTVTNQGATSQSITAGLRDVTTPLSNTTKTVTLPADAATFPDGVGVTRKYVETPFTVPAGADRLDASVAVPSDGSKIVRLALLDPSGAYSGYSLPQGFGGFGQVDVHQPAPGTWTAIVFSSASASGYAGPVSLRTRTYTAGKAGSVSPSSFSLASGASRTLTVTRTTPAQEARADSLVVTGSFGQVSSLPVVTRAVQAVSSARPTSFSGTFENANGRDFSPAQSDTFLFGVPSGAKDLGVTMAFTGTPANGVIAHLSGPDGEEVSTSPNQYPVTTGTGADEDTTITTAKGLQIIHANPVPGVYRLVVELQNPVTGAALPQTFSGKVTLGTSKVVAHGVPTRRVTALRGHAYAASITVTNTSALPQTYFIDARGVASKTYPLVPVGPGGDGDTPGKTTLPLASDDEVPSWLVPFQVSKLTIGASGQAPFTFDAAAQDNPTSVNDPGTDNVEATPNASNRTASVVHSAAEVTPSLWAAFPSPLGPVADPGTAPNALQFSASVVTKAFATDYTSSTGNPLLETVTSTVTAAPGEPVTVQPGKTVLIRLNLRPVAAKGVVVSGVLHLDTLSPFALTSGSTLGDEVFSLPYAYKVG